MSLLDILRSRSQGGAQANPEEEDVLNSPYLTEASREAIMRAIMSRQNRDMYPPQTGIADLLSMLQQGRGRSA